MELILENVRCFCGEHKFPIHPLTFLVGENSSGKTTALAMLSSALKMEAFKPRPSFNEPPYDMGSFDTIATSRVRKGGRSKSFAVGFSEEDEGRNESPKFLKILGTFVEKSGQPSLKSLSFETKEGKACVKLEEKKISTDLSFSNGGGRNKYSFSFEKEEFFDIGRDWLAMLLFNLEQKLRTQKEISRARFLDVFYRGWYFRARDIRRQPVSFAPVRTKPKRTYDQIKDEFSPEGGDVPLVLARVFETGTDAQRLTLLNSLKEFGKESGLYKNLRVKRLGKKPSDPFQVLITIAGPAANLQDVGYGVSQSLPIIVQSILAERGRRLLMQQPEVHLHPRAQAALGSLLVSLVMNDRKAFVIETHSDYIIDRVRQEIATGKIPHDAVSILYFEKKGVGAEVYPIYLDPEMKLIMRGNSTQCASS